MCVLALLHDLAILVCLNIYNLLTRTETKKAKKRVRPKMVDMAEIPSSSLSAGSWFVFKSGSDVEVELEVVDVDVELSMV